MSKKCRLGLAWTISLLAHTLLLIVAVPEGGGKAGDGMRLVEIGLVELPGPLLSRGSGADIPLLALPKKVPTTAPAPAKAPPNTAAPVHAPLPKSTLAAEPVPTPAPVPAKNSAAPPAASAAPQEGPPGNPGAAAGSNSGPAGQPETPGRGTGAGSGPGSGSGFGTGKGFVLDWLVAPTKSVQNAGNEQTVRLAIRLTPTGVAGVEPVKPTEEKDALYQYSGRVAMERWRYAAPPIEVRLDVTLIYRKDGVEVVFNQCTPWNGGGP